MGAILNAIRAIIPKPPPVKRVRAVRAPVAKKDGAARVPPVAKKAAVPAVFPPVPPPGIALGAAAPMGGLAAALAKAVVGKAGPPAAPIAGPVGPILPLAPPAARPKMNAILFGAAPSMAGSVSGPWTSTFSNALGNNLVQLAPGSFVECALTDPVSGHQ
eukprot:5667888-Karenia_brevis.AAC.1